MKLFIFLIFVFFQVCALAYNGEEGCTAPIDFSHYESQDEGERLIILNRFLRSGLCYVGDERPASMFARQIETAQRFVNSFSGCDDRLLTTARDLAWLNVGYGSPESVSYSIRERSRAMVQGIDRRCPPTIMANEVTAYIYGEDLYSYEQIRAGFSCGGSFLFVMGLRFRYMRDLTFEEYIEKFNLRYSSSEMSEQRFRQLGERRLQVQRDLESHCQRALETDDNLRRRYYDGAIISR